jgi:hypothetical protein
MPEGTVDDKYPLHDARKVRLHRAGKFKHTK